ncbi:hypothetical protein D3C81_1881710 [compost metagenome]
MDKTSRAYSPSYVKLSKTVARQMNMWVFDVAANLAFSVSIGYDLSDRTLALNLYRQLLFTFQHRTHHSRCCNCASKRSCRRRVRIMPAAELFHERSSTYGECTNLTTHRRTAN